MGCDGGLCASQARVVSEFLELPKGVPSADTLRRVMAALEPRVFEACFRSWVGTLAKALRGEVVAVDGKAIKGAYEGAHRTTPLYLSLIHI